MPTRSHCSRNGVLRLVLSAGLAALLLVGQTAHAQTSATQTSDTQAGPLPLHDIQTRIAALHAQGRIAEAADLAYRLHLDLSQEAGFRLRSPILITDHATGFGRYDPRPDAVFASGDRVHVYIEAIGVLLEAVGAEIPAATLDLEFDVIGPDKQRMSGPISTGVIVIESRSPTTDIYLDLYYDLTGFRGPVVLENRITERATGRMQRFSQRVEFR